MQAKAAKSIGVLKLLLDQKLKAAQDYLLIFHEV